MSKEKKRSLKNWLSDLLYQGSLKYTAGIVEMKRSSNKLAKSGSNNLTLFFDLDEYTSDEVADIIGLLSDLYESVGGDELEIKSKGIYQLTPQNTLELI